MLTITVPACSDLWDSVHDMFLETKETTLTLEHSLVSISKWESTWEKPFLSKNKKTEEEIVDYIRCMTISPSSVDPMVYIVISITKSIIEQIVKYIDSKMTATVINERAPKGKQNKEIMTSEVIYYLMVAYNIPFECQKWHLNRLLTLIKVCEIKNDPKKKKIPQKQVLDDNWALNEARRKALNSKG